MRGRLLWKKSVAEINLENERLWRDIQQLEMERVQLVDVVALQFLKGMDKGELSGWEEASHSFVDGGHISQVVIDSVICPFTLSEDGSDGEEE